MKTKPISVKGKMLRDFPDLLDEWNWDTNGDLDPNGRALAVAWLVLFALTVGDAGMVWGWPAFVTAGFVAQQIAAVAFIPLSAGLYVYKRALPQIARDEADERERAIQGDVYRRAHGIAIGTLAIGCALILANPAIGSGLALQAESRGVEFIDVLLPAFLLFFMLPSVAYAWMNPHRDDGSPDAPHATRLPGWLARAAAR
jgi:hypothetical protein